MILEDYVSPKELIKNGYKSLLVFNEKALENPDIYDFVESFQELCTAK